MLCALITVMLRLCSSRNAAMRQRAASKHYSSQMATGLQAMVEAGWSVEAVSFLSLQTAAKSLDANKVRSLLSTGTPALPMDAAEPGWDKLKDRTPPLLLAAAKKNGTEVVALLLESGCIAHAVGEHGQTALHKAAAGGDAEVVRLLLAHGGDPSAQNAAGDTALDLAERYGNAMAERELRAGHGQICVQGGWVREDGGMIEGRERQDLPGVGRVELPSRVFAEPRVSVARVGVWGGPRQERPF